MSKQTHKDRLLKKKLQQFFTSTSPKCNNTRAPRYINKKKDSFNFPGVAQWRTYSRCTHRSKFIRINVRTCLVHEEKEPFPLCPGNVHFKLERAPGASLIQTKNESNIQKSPDRINRVWLWECLRFSFRLREIKVNA